MEAMRTVKVLGRELRVGDVLQTWSGNYTITHFESHPGLDAYGKHHTARIACSGKWAMTVFDDEYSDVYRLVKAVQS